MYPQLKKYQKHRLPKTEASATKLKKISFTLIALYVAYLGKSALGINLLADYTAPKFLKAPFTTMDCIFPIEGNYCHKSKQEISLVEQIIL